MKNTSMFIFLGVLLSNPVWGEVPGMINYQGRLIQNSSLVNSNNMTVTLSLYNASTGGTLIYQEDDLVDVTDGLYSTYLGDNGNGSGSESDLTAALTVAGANAWLSITIDGSELTPRERVLAAPYALVAATSDGSSSVLSGFTNLTCDGFINCDLTFSVDFNPSFSQAPIVTLSAQTTSSLAGVSAEPFIFSTTPSNFTAQVTAAENAVETTRATDHDSDSFGYNSLSIVNGKPAISFQIRNEVWYVRADNADGTAWGSPQYIGAGVISSLVIVNGIPAISYIYPYGTTYLRFVRASDANGTSWGTTITLDFGISIYNIDNNSLAVIGNTPAVGYGGKYIRSSDTGGTTWGGSRVYRKQQCNGHLPGIGQWLARYQFFSKWQFRAFND
ncbi:MAG: hypothetical protein GKR87_06230 [Kiritimatiellae bacterium]|nr:hypothetical protein [Kiritimatiellia bacterium]